MSSFWSAWIAEDAADPRPLPLPRVEVERPLGERALVDPHERDLAERLFDQLERHGDERRIGVGRQRHLGPAVVVVLGEDLAVERAGQIAVDGVQQRLDALVAIGRADHHRADLLRDRRPRGSSCGSARAGPPALRAAAP